MMRCLRFVLVLSSTWATQWQQQQQQYNVPLQQEMYRDSTIQTPQSQYPHSTSTLAPTTTDTAVTMNAIAVPPNQQQQHQQLPIPHEHSSSDSLEKLEMNLEHVSLSLRLTCEMNRRLLQSIIQMNNNKNRNDRHGTSSNPLLQRGGDDTGMNHIVQHHPVNIHPSQSWQPPIASGTRPHTQDNKEEELSIFHAKSPRTSSKSKKIRRGVARWGPDLLTYLTYLVEQVLELPPHQRSLILALSLVYLDRACSVETIRSSGCPKVPFATPRTIHRLVLIALYTATRAVLQQDDNGDVLELRDKITKSLGIPASQFEQMQHAFMHALGDHGLYVDPVQLHTFMTKWQRTFDRKTNHVAAPSPHEQQVWA